MATKQATNADNIFAQLQLDAEQTATVKDLEKKQLELEEGDQQHLATYKQDVQQVLAGRADVSTLSKLEQGIQRGEEFKGEISEIAESLTHELNDLGQFFGSLSNYHGWTEKILAKVGFLRGVADKKRLARVRSADVKENLQTILDYGHHMVQKLYTAILENVRCQTKLQATVQQTATTLQQNQPLYEQWRSSREAFERQMKDIDAQIDQANAAQVSKLEGDKTKLEGRLHEAQVNENHFFTIVSKAREALPTIRTHVKAYKDMVDALTQIRTGLEHNIDHVTQVYLSVPVAIQTALSTKAASHYDKGMKFATDKATVVVLESAAGVLDEAASRAERPLLDPEKLKTCREAQRRMRADFEARLGALKSDYAKEDAPH